MLRAVTLCSRSCSRVRNDVFSLDDYYFFCGCLGRVWDRDSDHWFFAVRSASVAFSLGGVQRDSWFGWYCERVWWGARAEGDCAGYCVGGESICFASTGVDKCCYMSSVWKWNCGDTLALTSHDSCVILRFICTTSHSICKTPRGRYFAGSWSWWCWSRITFIITISC